MGTDRASSAAEPRHPTSGRRGKHTIGQNTNNVGSTCATAWEMKRTEKKTARALPHDEVESTLQINPAGECHPTSGPLHRGDSAIPNKVKNAHSEVGSDDSPHPKGAFLSAVVRYSHTLFSAETGKVTKNPPQHADRSFIAEKARIMVVCFLAPILPAVRKGAGAWRNVLGR